QRLEPTIHVTDTIKVHAQVDLLDNLVLGSTPDSFAGENPWAPIDLFTRTQLPPSAGINSWTDSIVVKRAWGEARFGWGLTLEFGRMPHHWGLGIVANDGNGYSRGEKADIVRMVDTDYGDSVDSVRLSFDFGQDKRNAITLGVSYDWAASGPTTAQLLGPQWQAGNRVAAAFSAELYDNVHQFSIWVTRHDDPAMLQRKLATGQPVINYGLRTWFRWQTLDRAIGTPGLGDGLGPNNPIEPRGRSHGASSTPASRSAPPASTTDGDTGLQNYANSLVHRRGWILTPDLWFRANWRTLRVELEAAAVVGSFRHRDTLDVERGDAAFDVDTVTYADTTPSTLLQFGYALEFKYGLFNDRLHIGVDHGFASGDASPPNQFDYGSPFPLPADIGDFEALNAFRFNPAYMQDLLLFKEILGTVSNASYVKPWLAFYFFQNNMSARADIEFAGAVDRRGDRGRRQVAVGPRAGRIGPLPRRGGADLHPAAVRGDVPLRRVQCAGDELVHRPERALRRARGPDHPGAGRDPVLTRCQSRARRSTAQRKPMSGRAWPGAAPIRLESVTSPVSECATSRSPGSRLSPHSDSSARRFSGSTIGSWSSTHSEISERSMSPDRAAWDSSLELGSRAPVNVQ
ncbi:MAG: hypothetical protein HC927_09580, partial [Deltaproteobacteria bacterium]|nr:hypothetical protein [Deltaproteobacteria bacterium]